jgi:hypothetical protein
MFNIFKEFLERFKLYAIFLKKSSRNIFEKYA